MVELSKPLMENQKLGWEVEQLDRVFKALSHVNVITQPMLSQQATVKKFRILGKRNIKKDLECY